MLKQQRFFAGKPICSCFLRVLIVCGVYVGFSGAVFASECRDGYDVMEHVDAGTFTRPVYDVCQFTGYKLVEIPDDFYPIYSAFVFGAEVPLCENGHLNGTTCEPFDQSVCDNGYYDLFSPSSSFVSMVDGECRYTGYQNTNITDDFYAIYSGFVFGDEVALCGPGTHPTADGCVADTQGDCPREYVEMSGSDAVLEKLSLGKCGTGYHNYQFSEQCNQNPSGVMCADVCDNDLFYTDIGTCATPCAQGATQLKIAKTNGEILSFPMWSTKQITPSVNFGFANGAVCYVNLLEGHTTDALHVSHPTNGKVYHTVR